MVTQFKVLDSSPEEAAQRRDAGKSVSSHTGAEAGAPKAGQAEPALTGGRHGMALPNSRLGCSVHDMSYSQYSG